ncbi:S-adenosyl-L-methionine-dependent methyltransferase [Pyronema omphalodes]|nr:S-adenosyl-L-methionine-dependent methyltransferase [Pyronema omphalodes]
MADTTKPKDDSAQGPLGSETYEEEHVHQVYQEIAPHFSATRFKPWPIVEKFLKEMPTGSIGLDVGCGNGKYLTVNPNIYMIGSDRSSNLVQIAYERKIHDSCVADGLSLPHPDGKLDFAISIAVIHHFSSPERRAEAIKAILATLNKQGRALIYVWALEQKNSRRGWDEGHNQDVWVPWVLSKQYTSKPNGGKAKKGNEQAEQAPKDASAQQGLANDDAETPNTEEAPKEAPKEVVYQRYYHLYRKGELETDIAAAGGVVLESGYEKDNWWAICGPK